MKSQQAERPVAVAPVLVDLVQAVLAAASVEAAVQADSAALVVLEDSVAPVALADLAVLAAVETAAVDKVLAAADETAVAAKVALAAVVLVAADLADKVRTPFLQSSYRLLARRLFPATPCWFQPRTEAFSPSTTCSALTSRLHK